MQPPLFLEAVVAADPRVPLAETLIATFSSQGRSYSGASTQKAPNRTHPEWLALVIQPLIFVAFKVTFTRIQCEACSHSSHSVGTSSPAC